MAQNNVLTKRTVLFVVALIILVLFLIGKRRDTRVENGADVDVPGLAVPTFVVPDLIIDPLGSRSRYDFDWMNGPQCGCDGGRIDALIIDSIGPAPRVKPGYNFIDTGIGSIPPGLQIGGGAQLGTVPPASYIPQPLRRGTARWGWIKGDGYGVVIGVDKRDKKVLQTQVLFTDDNLILATGQYNRPFNWLGSAIANLMTGAKDFTYNGKTYDIKDGVPLYHNTKKFVDFPTWLPAMGTG